MRLPLRLLSQHVRPSGEYADPEQPHGWDVDRLVDRLVMTGTEIEAVHRLGPSSPDGFVIGHVLEVEAHPDADRLRVCRVETGDGAVRNIVCGAANVAAGQVVPVALPGAVMPDGLKIKKAKLRGVRSEGMICSEAELGISAEGEGIMVLAETGSAEATSGQDGALRPGTPLADVLDLTDTVLELELTPNRSDCFGIYGLAREVAAITGCELQPEPWQADVEATAKDAAASLASVSVEAPDLCPRFTARVFEEVEVGSSPRWLKQALSALGQRPINNVVDITNYVMLVTGQPLHAFDLDRVEGGTLTIRRAKAGETVMTLDGVERALDEEMVVVCDGNGPAAIAGVMGGASTEVHEQTKRVLLEVANWDGPNILASSRRLALRSEASSRFERQLHPALCDRAQRLAARLLVDLCGARMAPGMIDVAQDPPPQRDVKLKFRRVASLLGVEVPADDARSGLERLGFTVEHPDDPVWSVGVSVDRYFDVTREADLIEEIGRLYGYENLPSTIPALHLPGELSRSQRLWRQVEDSLRYNGFDEIVGWSFTDPEQARRLRLGEAEDPVELANPLSADQSVMRTILLGSLLDAAAHNVSRDAERVALFESGRVYLTGNRTDGEVGADLAGRFGGRLAAPVLEPHRIAALLVGPLTAAGWDGSPPAEGFFALKAVLESLAHDLGLNLRFEATSRHGFLHPGRAAQVSLTAERQDPIGWIGELHPGVVAEWDLPEAGVVAFEVDLAPLVAAAPAGDEIYADVTSFPAVRQDLAIVIAEERTAGEVQEVVRQAGDPLLRKAEVFDLYHGEQLGAGHKSLALRLEFQAADRTLTEAEVAKVRERIEAAIEEIGGSIRE